MYDLGTWTRRVTLNARRPLNPSAMQQAGPRHAELQPADVRFGVYRGLGFTGCRAYS